VWRVVNSPCQFGKVQPCADEAENVQLEMLWNERSELGKQCPSQPGKSTMQHTYKEGDEFVFMDMETMRKAG